MVVRNHKSITGEPPINNTVNLVMTYNYTDLGTQEMPVYVARIEKALNKSLLKNGIKSV